MNTRSVRAGLIAATGLAGFYAVVVGWASGTDHLASQARADDLPIQRAPIEMRGPLSAGQRWNRKPLGTGDRSASLMEAFVAR